ncbi:MAG: hypothetical protein ACD_74C00137G0007 [uncultured bacterium]|nr:MAG: hypothetical protein ACD_74C00137G0007 [uncultured bacterium]
MKLKMTIAEALEFADEWSQGATFHEGSQGWRVVCMLLAEEVRRLHKIEAALAGKNGVLVRLDRPEDYNGVHPQLVAEDAIKDNWPSYETLTLNKNSSTSPYA